MKISKFIMGLVLGLVIGFGLTMAFVYPKSENVQTPKIEPEAEWAWEESLDALKAAPENHSVVFEDDKVRVLAVSLEAGKSEPIHTHKWKSIMWISQPIVPCKIYNYKREGGGPFVITDSILIPEMPVNKGQLIDPEGPTSIENLSNANGLAYRVEFKKEFKP